MPISHLYVRLNPFLLHSVLFTKTHTYMSFGLYFIYFPFPYYTRYSNIIGGHSILSFLPSKSGHFAWAQHNHGILSQVIAYAWQLDIFNKQKERNTFCMFIDSNYFNSSQNQMNRFLENHKKICKIFEKTISFASFIKWRRQKMWSCYMSCITYHWHWLLGLSMSSFH